MEEEEIVQSPWLDSVVPKVSNELTFELLEGDDGL